MSIKCETCGMEHETDPGKFCERCGRVLSRFNLELDPVDQEDEFKKCLKCGHRNNKDSDVCTNCGEKLHSPGMF